MHRTVGIAFGLLLLAVLITLAVVALFLVVNTFRGRRKVEPAFLAWIAAMHFATIPIRTFLPGSPPPGSWVDIAVVLWVIVALGTALAFGVGTWWRFGRLAQSGATEDVTPDAVGDSSESRGLIR